jgi:hypothetical protein
MGQHREEERRLEGRHLRWRDIPGIRVIVFKRIKDGAISECWHLLTNLPDIPYPMQMMMFDLYQERQGTEAYFKCDKSGLQLKNLRTRNSLLVSYCRNRNPLLLTLKSMLGMCTSLPECVFNADKGFDAEYNFERVCELLMHLNIKQRRSRRDRRGRVVRVFTTGAGRRRSSTLQSTAEEGR